MMHKKTVYFLFAVTITLISVYNTAICMDLNDDKAQAKIDLLRKQLEIETLKQTQQEALNTEKLNAQKAKVQKLESDIRQHDLHIKTIDGLIEGGSQGLAQGISNTLQHGGKKIIDLWLDGSLTTAEALMELEKREDILTKRIQNTKEAATAQRAYLRTPAEVEALNKQTLSKIKNIERELDKNAELYEQVVAGRSKQQPTKEDNKITTELPLENKSQNDPIQPENSNNSINEVKVKTGLFAAISAPCIAVATKAGEYADFLAGYSFAYLTELPGLKETFIGKHSVGINRALVAATLIATTYAAYHLYTSKTQTDDDGDIFNDDDNYKF
ncbi:MAG TPA: hypothetical protein VHX42_02520 [Candidatus Babeliales bacterium]|jgi:hypothetical protein|nr:hypothetical protein [Candidatus Babeliales bacterium]